MNTLKLSASTVLYHEMELFHALDLIAMDGFKYVEIVDVPGFCPHLHYGANRSQFVQRIKEKLTRNGMSITSLYLSPGSLLTNEVDATTRSMQNGFELATELNVSRVTIIPGPKVDDKVWEETAADISQGLRRIAGLAEEYEIQFQIESPHLNTFTETIDQTARLFEILNDLRVFCTFDTSHVFRGEKTTPLQGLEMIGLDRIGNIHLRDVKGEDISITPGKGHVDFRSFIRRLRDKGYSGGVSLELEFSNYSISERRAELRYAREYIEAIWTEREIPSGLRLRAIPAVQSLVRLVHNPKRELRKIDFLKKIYHKLWALVAPFRPVRTYEGVWKNKFNILKQSKPVVQKAGSIPLVGPIPKPFRVGILGCGYAGEMHAAGFSRLAGVQLLGVADVVDQKSRKLAKDYHCESFTSLDEMTARLDLDLVSVCTREWLHYEPVLDLLRKDIDVFSEKILSANYNQAREMVSMARERGRVMGVNYNYRFMPGVQKLKEIIDNCYFGKLELLNVKVHAFSYHHALDLVSFLGGNILSVSASYQNEDALRPFGGMDWKKFDPDILYVPSRNLAATFEMHNKAVCVVTSSYFFDPFGLILSIDALFENGAVTLSGIRMDDVVGHLSWTTKRDMFGLDLNHQKGVFARGYEYCFYRSIESFMNAYINGMPPETSGEQGLFNIQLEKAAYRSNVGGRKIVMDEFPEIVPATDIHGVLA
jgi:predicted dehydrogenase/sugar phosphate isomerase/epimerase